MDIAAVTKKAIEETLGIDKGVDPNAKLVDLGCDEIDVMDIILTVEEDLDITIDTEDEEELMAPGATVQTAIDLFTKLSTKS